MKSVTERSSVLTGSFAAAAVVPSVQVQASRSGDPADVGDFTLDAMELRDLIATTDETNLKRVEKGLGETAADVTASRLIDCRRRLDAHRALRAVQHADAVR